MKEYKISIIVPVFNAGQYLKECLDSILIQTEKDFELIIVNDGSTDNSMDIIKSYLDDRIKLINLENNLGKHSAGAINLGLKNVTGKYVTWISADDFLIDEDVLIKLVTYLEFFNEVDMISGNYSIVNSIGEKINNIVYEEDIVTYEKMKCFNYICPSFLFKKTCIDKIGFLNEDLVGVADWDYWLRMSKDFKIYKIENILYCWRFHGLNTAEKYPEKYRQELEWIKNTYK